MPPKGHVTKKVLDKLQDVAKFITDYSESHHYPPSRRELAAEFETSTSVISFYIRHMVALGMAWYEPYISRSLTIIQRKESPHV